MLSVFVACPYSPVPIEGYRDAFKQVERDLGSVKFVFADEHIDSDVILQKIDGFISTADLTICDITGWNPNVALELGLALGKQKRVQIIFHERKWSMFGFGGGKAHEVPIDIRGHGRINYQDKSTLVAALTKRIKQDIQTFEPALAARSFQFLTASVFNVIESEPGLKINEIASRLGMVTAQLTAHLTQLLEDDRIEKRGKTTATAYYKKGYVVPVHDGASASPNAAANPAEVRSGPPE